MEGSSNNQTKVYCVEQISETYYILLKSKICSKRLQGEYTKLYVCQYGNAAFQNYNYTALRQEAFFFFVFLTASNMVKGEMSL